uniref:Secreted protein n=1 Tax=Setaria italica TaxID=4555 RepID=K3XNZ2_SETIT
MGIVQCMFFIWLPVLCTWPPHWIACKALFRWFPAGKAPLITSSCSEVNAYNTPLYELRSTPAQTWSSSESVES